VTVQIRRALWRTSGADPSNHEPLISEISHGWTRSSVSEALVAFMERHMSMPISTGTDASRDSGPAPEKPVVISADDARQGAPGHQLLYVLGFGTTGAIFAVAAVLAYFELFRARS